MTAGPTRGAEQSSVDRSWSSRPMVARALRVAIVVSPAVVSLVVTWIASPHLYRPAGHVGLALFLLQLGTLGFSVAVVTERITRRFVPLANLLGMSLVFPDHAPSRFGVALRSGTVRQLEQEVEHLRLQGLSSDSAEAASQLLVLVNALGKHERLTRGHTERVRAYTDLIGEELDLPAADRELLHWAALCHDIGKLAVPAPILSKADRLDDTEWQTVKLHPEIGAQLVEPLEGWLGDWRLAASQHHERWDGAGYPSGLAGTQISLAGRIVAVADTYDVITSSRSYKTAASADEGRKELVRCAGSQFDPDVVRAFLAVSIGRLHPFAGRFAWMAHVGTAFQSAPAALQTAMVGAVGVGAAVATGAVDLPREPNPTEQVATAPALGDGAGRAVDHSTTTTSSIEPAGAPLPPPTSTTIVVEQSQGLSFPSIPTSTTGIITGASPPSTSGPVPASSSTSSVPAGSSSSTTSAPGPSSTSSTTSSTTTSTTSTTTTLPVGADCDRAQKGGDLDLDDADLAHCDLSGVDLTDSQIRDADLTGAILDGAVLADTTLHRSNLTGVTGISADLHGANLDDAVLIGAFLPKSTFEEARLHRSHLRGAVFTNGNFVDAHLEDADAGGAVFENVNVHKLRIKGTNLTTASLLGASGRPSNHDQAVWSSTTCPDGIVQSTDCYRP